MASAAVARGPWHWITAPRLPPRRFDLDAGVVALTLHDLPTALPGL